MRLSLRFVIPLAFALAAVRRELGTSCEELIYRYRTPDGFAGDEGAFVEAKRLFGN